MNCIVTAGPTYEPLDDVRRLTNFSTGRLGTELANFLTARGHKVTLLIGKMATYKGECKAQSVKTFSTTTDLHVKLKSFSGKKVDAIFHAAAVSDFAFGKIFAVGQASSLSSSMEKISQSIVEDWTGKMPVPLKGAKKISAREGKLLAELLPTPKIISELRGWFPKSKIVGWKFEADGKRANAIRAARKQLVGCATDACVANGPAYGGGFGLVTRKMQTHFARREKLFEALEKFARRT